MKKITTSVFSLLVFLFHTFAAYADTDVDKFSWPPMYNTGDTSNQPLLGYSLTISDQTDDYDSGASFIRTFGLLQPYCGSFTDPICLQEVKKGNPWWASVTYPPCISETENAPCILGVRVTDETGRTQKLKLERELTGISWDANADIGLPRGSMPSLWVTERQAGTGKGYMVTAKSGLSVINDNLKNTSTVKTVIPNNFEASVRAYSTKFGTFSPPVFRKLADGRHSYSVISPQYCIWMTASECGLLEEFNSQERIELQLHVPKRAGEWLMGRLSKPNISIGAIDSKSSQFERLTISGQPVSVPLFSTKVEAVQATQEMKDQLTNNKNCMALAYCRSGYYGGVVASSGDYAFKQFRIFEKFFGENANKVFPRWSVRSLSNSDPVVESCLIKAKSEVSGIVTTNASIYDGEPPRFENNEFTYRVAALHKLPNGEIFRGTYDLALSGTFARCLYGFSKAPIQASIQVTSASGEQQIATTSYSELNDWIYVSASGFTFSEPEIKARLLQDKQVMVAPSAAPSPAPSQATSTQSAAATPAVKAPAKRVSITCVKGKLTRKVAGVAPKCPAGFKKK